MHRTSQPLEERPGAVQGTPYDPHHAAHSTPESDRTVPTSVDQRTPPGAPAALGQQPMFAYAGMPIPSMLMPTGMTVAAGPQWAGGGGQFFYPAPRTIASNLTPYWMPFVYGQAVPEQQQQWQEMLMHSAAQPILAPDWRLPARAGAMLMPQGPGARPFGLSPLFMPTVEQRVADGTAPSLPAAPLQLQQWASLPSALSAHGDRQCVPALPMQIGEPGKPMQQGLQPARLRKRRKQQTGSADNVGLRVSQQPAEHRPLTTIAAAANDEQLLLSPNTHPSGLQLPQSTGPPGWRPDTGGPGSMHPSAGMPSGRKPPGATWPAIAVANAKWGAALFAPSARTRRPDKRPMNAFILFSMRYRPLLRRRYPHMRNKMITCMLGSVWRAMLPEDRAFYLRAAMAAWKAYQAASQPSPDREGCESGTTQLPCRPPRLRKPREPAARSKDCVFDSDEIELIRRAVALHDKQEPEAQKVADVAAVAAHLPASTRTSAMLKARAGQRPE